MEMTSPFWIVCWISPFLAVITASGDLDPGLPLFADSEFRPLVIAGGDADAESLAALADVADIESVDSPSVEPAAALRILFDRGHRVALLEGGPSLNGRFAAQDLIDEWNMTISPTLVAGDGPSAATSEISANLRFELSRIWRSSDDMLMAQWCRKRSYD